MARITVKALSADLRGAAEAAIAHFRKVGVTPATVKTFVASCREADVLVGQQGNTLILAHRK